MAVSRCEREMTDLQMQGTSIHDGAAWAFYDSKSAKEITEIGQELANISEQLVSLRNMEAQEALEQFLVNSATTCLAAGCRQICGYPRSIAHFLPISYS